MKDSIKKNEVKIYVQFDDLVLPTDIVKDEETEGDIIVWENDKLVGEIKTVQDFETVYAHTDFYKSMEDFKNDSPIISFDELWDIIGV